MEHDEHVLRRVLELGWRNAETTQCAPDQAAMIAIDRLELARHFVHATVPWPARAISVRFEEGHVSEDGEVPEDRGALSAAGVGAAWLREIRRTSRQENTFVWGRRTTADCRTAEARRSSPGLESTRTDHGRGRTNRMETFLVVLGDRGS